MCGGCNSYELYFIKYKNDMHTLQHSKSHLDCLAFKLSKLRFQRHNLFDNFLKRLLTCIIDEAGGVLGATPEGMGHILLRVKTTLNARINMF